MEICALLWCHDLDKDWNLYQDLVLLRTDLFQVTAGSWRPCPVCVAARSSSTAWCPRTRTSRTSMPESSASSSGSTASGWRWSWMTACHPTATSWSSCTPKRWTSSGVRCWRRPTPSECWLKAYSPGLCADVSGSLQAVWLLWGSEGRLYLRGDGGFHWWRDGDVWPEAGRPSKLLPDHAESLREELPHGMLHWCKLLPFCTQSSVGSTPYHAPPPS